MWRVPVNQRCSRPICPSAARVPTSAESRRRTAGLVGASGASRLMHCSPRHRVALDRGQDLGAHGFEIVAGIEQAPRAGEHVGIMDLDLRRT